MKKKLSSIARFLIFLGVGLFLVYLSLRGLRGQDLNNMLQSMQHANYWWVIVSVILGILSHYVRASRWRRLMRPMGYNPGIKNTFYAVMIGYLANLAIPRMGEVSRCGVLNRTEKIPLNKLLGTVITERALDMLVFMILFVITFFWQYDLLNDWVQENVFRGLTTKFDGLSGNLFLAGVLFGILALFIGVYYLIRPRLRKLKSWNKFLDLLQGFWHGLKSLLKVKKPWMFILETLAIWVLYYFMIYICFFAFSDLHTKGFEVGLAILVLGSIGIMVTPGGLGLYPIIVQQTMALYGVTKSVGFALGWVTWSAQTFMIILAGSISLLLLSFNKRRNYAPA